MKSKLSLLGAIAGFAILSTGCATSGVLVSTNSTNVQLSQPNFRIVATSLTGQSSADYLFGASFGLGMYNQTVALIPLKKDRALYRLAIQNLWANFESKYGKVDGRTLAIINVRYDTESLNLFFYTKPRLTVVADVVEFTK